MIRHFDIDHSVPTFLLVTPTEPYLRGELDTETGKVTITNPQNGKSVTVNGMDAVKAEFNGFAFTWHDGAEGV